MSEFIAAELRARRRMIGGLAAGAFSYLLLLALSFHSIGVVAFGHAFERGMPKSISAFSGSRSTDILSPHGWMGLGFNHPMLMITALTAAIAIGAGAIAGEIETGRAQLLFSAPVARSRFLAAGVCVWLIAETLVVGAALSGAVLGALLSGDLRHAGVAALAWAPVQFFPLTLFVASVAFAASAASETRSRALGIAISVSVFGYLVNVISGLFDSLSWLRWTTPFGYYDPGAAIEHGPRIGPIGVLLACSVLLLAFARRAFLRRDVA